MEGYPTALSATIRFLGNIYVAKLSQGNCSFRLDIDHKLDHDQAIEATQRLLANDLLLESYPETLRLAHIYSTFTANEVIGIQRFLAQTYGIRTVTRPNIRRLLFGPYGKGPEGA
jgi:glycyl-tRNA synthetase alpha subunit